MPILSRPLRAIFRAGCAVALAALAACGGRSKPPEGGVAPRAPGTPPPRTVSAGPEFDAARLYTQMGFLSAGAPLPFIGAVSYLATAIQDSTDVTLGLSLANASLSFVRDADRFVGGYSVNITLRQGGTVVREVSAHETVRLASYKETSRIDESIVFQQGFVLAPGQYALAVSVRDDGNGRTSTQEMLIAVPRLGAPGTLSTPVPFLQVVPRRLRTWWATRARRLSLVATPPLCSTSKGTATAPVFPCRLMRATTSGACFGATPSRCHATATCSVV